MQETAEISSSTKGAEVLTPDLERKLLDLINDLESFRQEKWFAQKLNIFEAAGLYRQEIRHSTFLAFLLDPQQKHGLGDVFLKRLIQRAADKLPGDPPIRALKIALSDFSDALVSREWRNIDLFIESKNNELIFVVENKVDSTERAKQLEEYETIVCSEYPSHARLFCYLTPEGDSASRNTWSSIGYADVVEALQDARRSSNQLTTQAEMVIDHYVDLIRRNIVPDQNLIEQCRKLYARHKDVLNLIFQYGEVNSFSSAASNFFDNHRGELMKFEIRPARAGFLPKTLLDHIPEIEGTNWWGQSRPLVFWFNLYDGKFGIVIEVGPFSSDKFSREVFVKRLQDHFNSKARIYPKFTRVYSRYVKLTEDQLSDPQEILSHMEALYKEAAKHLVSLTVIVEEFFGK